MFIYFPARLRSRFAEDSFPGMSRLNLTIGWQTPPESKQAKSNAA